MPRTTDVVLENCQALVELVERESRIERAQRNAYYEIGLDLMAIRDRGLYKSERAEPVAGRYSFTTFEEYVQDRWEMTPQRCGQIINAANSAAKLETIVSVLPSRESHVRELLKLESDEDQATVWQSVVDRGETIKASTVTEEVELFKALKAKDWFTCDEWTDLSDEEWEAYLNVSSKAKFNKQDNNSIEWAQWSWNPVTGCKHDCPYCYARDIASRFYPQKFEPSIYPGRLHAPVNTNVPDKANDDLAFKNVFTCSMADLFGKWVPLEWIDLVMAEVADNPQWNFLFLTKFPQRFAELKDIPRNAWLGTTVDCQSRVANAEKAFAKVAGGTKWLSVEPMLTPLKFKHLEVFDWVVMGGASSSTKAPAWIPPYDWVHDLYADCRSSDCKVYHKDNLGFSEDMRIKEFPWGDVPLPRTLPDKLKYLDIA